jgi:hypothetical protein
MVTLSVSGVVAASSPSVADTTSGTGGIPAIVTGAGPGGGPHVKVFNVQEGLLDRQFFAYDGSFRGGVRVAVGDVDGDGTGDIVTAPGPGGGPHVKVFSGRTGAVIRQFFAYAPAVTGGVFVATLYYNRDCRAEIVTGADAGGGPQVEVFDVRNATPVVVASFYAYDPAFRGGVRVSAADVDGDGVGDVVTAAGPGGGPHVRVLKLNASPGGAPSALLNIFPEDPGFHFGLYAAASRDASSAVRIVISPGATGAEFGSPYARTYDASGTQLGQTFFQYGEHPGRGTTLALANLDGDAADEIVGGYETRGSIVVAKDIHGNETKFATEAYGGFTGGIFVAAGRI